MKYFLGLYPYFLEQPNLPQDITVQFTGKYLFAI